MRQPAPNESAKDTWRAIETEGVDYSFMRGAIDSARDIQAHVVYFLSFCSLLSDKATDCPLICILVWLQAFCHHREQPPDNYGFQELHEGA